MAKMLWWTESGIKNLWKSPPVARGCSLSREVEAEGSPEPFNYYFAGMHVRDLSTPRSALPEGSPQAVASFPPSTYEGVTGNEHHIGPLGHLQLLPLGSGGGRRERRRRDHTHPQRQHRLQGCADLATEPVSSGLPPSDDLDSVYWSNVWGTAKLQLPSGSEHAHVRAWSPLTLNPCKDHFNQISS